MQHKHHHQQQLLQHRQQKRSALDPCVAGRGKAKADVTSSCHPTILSHGMFHRHPSLSIEHFHFPSLSDSNPFPWLDAGGPQHQRGRRASPASRRDSVFAASWDSLIDRHLCNPRCNNASAAHAAARFGLVRDYLDEAADDDADDDVFAARQQLGDAAHAAAATCGAARRGGSRDPRWREAIAEAVRRQFDFAACRRAYRDRIRVPVKLPGTGLYSSDGKDARRRLEGLLGTSVVLLCDRDYIERLSDAMSKRRMAELRDRELRLAEAERLRQLRLL